MSLGNLTIEQEPVNATSKVPVITNWTPVIGYMIYNSDRDWETLGVLSGTLSGVS